MSGSLVPSAAEFSKSGYTIVRSAIPENQRAFLYQYVVAQWGKTESGQGDAQVPGTPFAYGDFVMDGLLKSLEPLMESCVGLDLYPTYSYLRIYKRGDSLKRHVDRPACEISATLCLGYTPDSPWPIWVESAGEAMPIALLGGDMLIYRGMDIPHWRQVYEGERMAQVFLHYVDRKGPHAEWKFDKRTALKTQHSDGMPGANAAVPGRY